VLIFPNYTVQHRCWEFLFFQITRRAATGVFDYSLCRKGCGVRPRPFGLLTKNAKTTRRCLHSHDSRMVSCFL